MSAAADTAAALRALANKATQRGLEGRATELTTDDVRLLHRAADRIAPLPTFASVDAAFDSIFAPGTEPMPRTPEPLA